MNPFRLALGLSVLPALPLQAALQISTCDRLREVAEAVADAVTVIQIADHVVEWDGFRCRVTGTVVRSFRGSLEPGSPVQTSFRCGEASTVEIVRDPETVARAAVIEIHAQAAGGPAAGGAGLLLLDAPTDAPAFRIDFPQECDGE